MLPPLLPALALTVAIGLQVPSGGTTASDATPTPAFEVASSGRVSLFTALEEQLGLKLEPAMAPVQVLVIDAIERPAPN